MALVRARRLVFRIGSINRPEAVTEYGTYYLLFRCSEFVPWRGEQQLGDAFATTDEAIAVCQKDYDSKWLADTEVMPLEWSDTPVLSRSENGTGSYFVEPDPNMPESWMWDAPFCKQEKCNSLDHGKQLCNEHNRKTILGE